MRWIVQQYVGGPPRSPHWVDVLTSEPEWEQSGWEAEDAFGAFKLAVLDNRHEKLETTSYRVLPYGGGVTFNISVNVDAEEHRRTS